MVENYLDLVDVWIVDHVAGTLSQPIAVLGQFHIDGTRYDISSTGKRCRLGCRGHSPCNAKKGAFGEKTHEQSAFHSNSRPMEHRKIGNAFERVGCFHALGA